MEEKPPNFGTPASDKEVTGAAKKKKLYSVIACSLIAISFYNLSGLKEKSYDINYMKDGSYNTFAPISKGAEQLGDFFTSVVYTVVGAAGVVILLYYYFSKVKK
jgi:hypothetical protein